MHLGSFVTQIFTGAFFIWVIRKYTKQTKGAKQIPQTTAKLLFILLLSIILSWDIFQFINPDNYYTFFGLKRRFLPQELKKQKLSLSRQFHPDKSDSDGNEFTKVQELFEIFNSPKNTNLLLIYDLYKTDLMTLYFDKSANKEISSYQTEKSLDIWVENYMILFLMIFVMKELNIKNKRPQFLFFVLLGSVVLAEIVVYNIYPLFITDKDVFLFFDQIVLFEKFRTIEIIEFLKRFVVAFFLVFLAFYDAFLKHKKSKNLESQFQEMRSLKTGDEENVKELADFMKKKVNKLQSFKKSQHRTMMIFLVIITVYWAASFYEFY